MSYVQQHERAVGPNILEFNPVFGFQGELSSRCTHVMHAYIRVLLGRSLE